MRFELLQQRVERAERRAARCVERARRHRSALGEAWRRGWTPGRILAAGALAGFLVGRAEPLSRVGGARWLQLMGTVSSLLASLRAASASEEASATADVAQEVAAVAATAAGAPVVAPAAAPAATHAPAEPHARAPAPAEAATELSER